jgi:DNA-binding Lrp family transcriptional regulator
VSSRARTPSVLQPKRDPSTKQSSGALPLSLSEKVALEQIHQLPGCSNERLADLIGISCRGVENLLRRLRDQGFIEQVGKGRARRHLLKFAVEAEQPHTLCGNDNNDHSCAESHTLGGERARCRPIRVAPKHELTLAEDYDRTLRIIDELCRYENPFPDAIANLYGRILRRVANEAPESSAKDKAVKELTLRRDAFVAISVASQMPRKYHRQASQLIHDATPEQLAEIRRRVEAGQLDPKNPRLLTALGNEPVLPLPPT